MKKLHFGCGPYPLDGWENYDKEINLCKPLPFENASVDFIFSEHVVEHLPPIEAWNYFEECLRILKPGGVARTTIPDLVQTWASMTPEYAMFVHQRGWGDGSRKAALRHLVFLHEHRSIWTRPTLQVVLEAIGFEAQLSKPYESTFPELANIEQHGRSLGKTFNLLESASVDARKPSPFQ